MNLLRLSPFALRLLAPFRGQAMFLRTMLATVLLSLFTLHPSLFRSASADDNAPPLDKLDRSAEWVNNPNVHMIAIEALVVEVNEDKTRQLGLKFGFAPNSLSNVIQGADVVFGQPLSPVSVPTLKVDSLLQTSTAFTPRLPGLGFNLSGVDVGGGVLSAKIRALLDRGEAHIVTRPIILAVNNTPTMLQVGSKIPYQDVNPANGYPIISEGTVGVSMDVLPSIVDLAKQTVQLKITKVEVATLSNFITTQNVNRPVFNTANTRTDVTMHSGETYQLSSLKGRRSKTVREGIPILMHIPILGHLFSSRQEVMENTDILFFVTPHIVPPGQNVLLPYDFQNGNDLIEQGLTLPEQKNKETSSRN